MWIYGIALSAEIGLIWLLLFRSYRHYKQRTKSDRVILEQEHYKTAKFRLDLAEMRNLRDLAREMEDILHGH